MNKPSINHALAALLLGCIALTACDKKAERQEAAEYPLYTVKVADKVLKSAYSATIRGRQDIDIYPQVEGKLTRLCVKEGDAVRKGQLLFVIDQVPFRAALTTAIANVSAAKAALSTARLTLDSKRELHRQNIVSAFDLSTAENAWQTVRAQLQQAQAGEVNARNNLSYTEVRSPSDGVVGMLPYRVGTLVGPGIRQPLTTVSDNSTMFVYFSMAEKQMLDMLRRYGSKQAAIDRLPDVELQLSDNSVYSHKGRIESISGVIDRTTGSAGVRAVFKNPEGLLLSGTSGNVLVPSLRTNCLTIPRAAVFEIQDKMYIYKVVNGKAVSKQVEVTRADGGNEYIVESGLHAGDVIIAKGVGLVREGAEVSIKTGKEAK